MAKKITQRRPEKSRRKPANVPKPRIVVNPFNSNMTVEPDPIGGGRTVYRVYTRPPKKRGKFPGGKRQR